MDQIGIDELMEEYMSSSKEFDIEIARVADSGLKEAILRCKEAHDKYWDNVYCIDVSF